MVSGRADDTNISVLDELLRRAGLRREHVGCWTNTTRRRTCERCGARRTVLEATGDALP